jgi:hypothetical protein
MNNGKRLNIVGMLSVLFIIAVGFLAVRYEDHKQAREEQEQQHEFVIVFDLDKFPTTPAEWKHADAAVSTKTERSLADANNTWDKIQKARDEVEQTRTSVPLPSEKLSEARDNALEAFQGAVDMHELYYRGLERECEILNRPINRPDTEYPDLGLSYPQIQEPRACAVVYHWPLLR